MVWKLALGIAIFLAIVGWVWRLINKWFELNKGE